MGKTERSRKETEKKVGERQGQKKKYRERDTQTVKTWKLTFRE